MKYNLFSRRMFLQGAGQLLPMPFLISVLPRELWAQASATAPKRYIAVSSNYDYGRHSNWFPSLAQPPRQLVSTTGDRTLRYEALSSYLTSSSSPLSLVFGNHLNPYLNQINLVRGLDQSTRIAHGTGYIFGNMAANDGHDSESVRLAQLRTIDQVLRDNTRFNPKNADVAIMGNASRSFRRDSAGNISRASLISGTPRGTFNYLFNNGSLPEGGSPPQTVDHPRRNLLTSVLGDYTRVRNGRQISSQDRLALDNAMDLISDIQRGLASTEIPGSGSCVYRHIPTTGDGDSYFNSSATMKAYADIIVAAVMCDVTRVFNFSANLNEYHYDVNPTEDFHQGHSHIPFTLVNGKVNWQYMGEVQNQFVRNFLTPLIAGLSSATDPTNSRSYLYNSLVHYTVESSQVHGLNSTPCLLAGNAGGALSSGNYLDYTDRTRIHNWVADSFSNVATNERFAHEYVGVPLNRLFNTILQAMGLTPGEYENPNINTHFQGRSDSRYGAINNGISSMGGYGHWGPATSNYGADYMNRQPTFNLHHFKNVLLMPPA